MCMKYLPRNMIFGSPIRAIPTESFLFCPPDNFFAATSVFSCKSTSVMMSITAFSMEVSFIPWKLAKVFLEAFIYPSLISTLKYLFHSNCLWRPGQNWAQSNRKAMLAIRLLSLQFDLLNTMYVFNTYFNNFWKIYFGKRKWNWKIHYLLIDASIICRPGQNVSRKAADFSFQSKSHNFMIIILLKIWADSRHSYTYGFFLTEKQI